MIGLIEVNRVTSPLAVLYRELSRFPDCRAICLLHVIASGRPAEVESGQRVLRAALRALRALDPKLAVEARLEIGQRGERLLRVAEEIGAGLIVMAAHGEGEFPRLSGAAKEGGAPGRVARGVVEQRGRPVLVVSPGGSKLYQPRRSGPRRRQVATRRQPAPA